MIRKSAVFLACVLCLLGARPAYSFFEIPYLIQLVHQGIKMYSLERQTQNLIKSAGMWIKNRSSWQTMATDTAITAAESRGTEMTGWGGAMSTGANAPAVWNRASVPLPQNIPNIGINRRIDAQVATVEAVDDAAISAMMTHGRSIPQLQQLAQSVMHLKRQVFDERPELNSQVQQLNLLNAGQSQQADLQQTATQVQMAQLKLQVAQAKQQRDQIADSLQFAADVDRYAQTEGYGLGRVAPSMNWIPK